jgi:hypothetical protein
LIDITGDALGGTLKAVVQTKYGTPDAMRLENIDTPSIGDNEVLVGVRAASVNPPDWAGVHGVPYIVRAAFGLRGSCATCWTDGSSSLLDPEASGDHRE